VNRFRILLLLVAAALLIAWGGAYLAVVSQNPGGQPTGVETAYGPSP
jgi:ABC-type transporter Mla subunit MlaD